MPFDSHIRPLASPRFPPLASPRLPPQPTLTQDLPPRIPALAYRHASPSGPWPWLDLEYDSDSHQGSPETIRGIFPCPHTKGECKGFTKCWSMYPQNLFPNWTPGQVKRSRIAEMAARSRFCTIYVVDVDRDGHFFEREKLVADNDSIADHVSLMRAQRPENTLVRALFMDNLSKPVLQVLGTKYEIEPFYFSSSLNQIPSRYQENIQPNEGDHITITMSFIRCKKMAPGSPRVTSAAYGGTAPDRQLEYTTRLELDDGFRSKEMSSTKPRQYLLKDLLAIHMIRRNDSSTILSYHAPYSPTSAKALHNRVALTGESVYWQKLFEQSRDPTLVLLSIFWYALYAWDESFAALWSYISRLESQVLLGEENLAINRTQNLHKVRGHLLYYVALLEDFRQAIEFIRDTPNPAMDSWSIEEREKSKGLLRRECSNLLTEIDRLFLNRDMQDKQLKNVMDLAFSTVNAQDSRRMAALTTAALEDSRVMKDLTKASLKDSASMKQIAYLTMIFLPASFAASVFGMNIVEIVPPNNAKSTAGEYLALAVPLTGITIWVLIALEAKWHTSEGEKKLTILERLCWPLYSLKSWWNTFQLIVRESVSERPAQTTLMD
ncbi:hypothetical protein M422DRAFT_222053, partial [Sphaerobolus stellatus SS14]